MYQALKVYFCLLLFLVAPALLADSNSSTVNERIPVRRAELEAHWKVNCGDSWVRLTGLLGKSVTAECGIPPGLQREIKLCGFIYQPPGDELSHPCPDYRSADLYLEQVSRESNCPVLADLLVSGRNPGCKNGPDSP